MLKGEESKRKLITLRKASSKFQPLVEVLAFISGHQSFVLSPDLMCSCPAYYPRRYGNHHWWHTSMIDVLILIRWSCVSFSYGGLSCCLFGLVFYTAFGLVVAP
ncbi:hypothetical protein V6N13_136402 [Hibiscus sabdariffa]|uniref:Uncharacterized protein n=1 Tax=Hibiscus sabdariffa TaxID=183260 RepID=A0ABR2DP57_9ROSI